MKTTTRLYDVIYTTYNQLYSDFIDNHQITYFNPELQFTHKVLEYDDEVKSVCRNTIFYGLDFLSDEVRDDFELEFLAKFLPRTIKFQTYETFNWRLVGIIRGIKDILEDYYINSKKYLNANVYTHGNSTASSSGTTENRDNNLEVTLPQDNTDLSLDKDTYDYADTTAHSKSRTSDATSQNTNQESNAISYDVGRLGELQAFHDNLFNELDRMLFSQIM